AVPLFFAIASIVAGSAGADTQGSADVAGSPDASARDGGGARPDEDGGRASPADPGAADAAAVAALPACEAPKDLGRGVAWVRANPMMIAGLSVVMGAPASAAVTEYFDGFHATAPHVWENGLPAEI